MMNGFEISGFSDDPEPESSAMVYSILGKFALFSFLGSRVDIPRPHNKGVVHFWRRGKMNSLLFAIDLRVPVFTKANMAC